MVGGFGLLVRSARSGYSRGVVVVWARGWLVFCRFSGFRLRVGEAVRVGRAVVGRRCRGCCCSARWGARCWIRLSRCFLSRSGRRVGVAGVWFGGSRSSV